MLARAAAGALGSLCAGLTLVVVAIAAIGVLGTRASTRLGIATASDELTTSTATGKLAQDMDAAYATGEGAFLASAPARQSQLLGSLYTTILPATDTQLAYFEQLHAGDPPAEHADIERFAGQWAAVRDLLSPTDVTGHPDTMLASRLMTAYQPVNADLNRLFLKEQHDGHTDQAGHVRGRGADDRIHRRRRRSRRHRSACCFCWTESGASDQWGHAVGDQVLANVGAVLRSVLRTRDFAGRNGGEEFAVLLPDTEIAAALEIAERVRAAIAEITLPSANVSVTASIGVGGYPDHASTLDRLERLADAALYVAKRQGRNRVELAVPSVAEAAADLPEPTANGSRRPCRNCRRCAMADREADMAAGRALPRGSGAGRSGADALRVVGDQKR